MSPPDMAIGIARTLAGIAAARAMTRAISMRATDFAMAGKVTRSYDHFKPTREFRRAGSGSLPFERTRISSHNLALSGTAISVMLLFGGSIILSNTRPLPSSLRLIGSAGLMMVERTHVAEAFELVP